MNSIDETSERRSGEAPGRGVFHEFVEEVDVRLRSALMATFGPMDGRAAAVDALSWAWEHWATVRELENPVGYLYRVGRTAARRSQGRPVPVSDRSVHIDDPSVSPELVAALANLSAQQRTAVILVHAFGWTHRETAELLEMTPSSVQIELVNGVPLKRGRRRHRTPQPRPHRPWLAAAVVAIVVAGIAAVWAVARNDTSTPPVPADQPTAPVSTASSSDSSESDGDLGGPASEGFASELPAPVSGETQRTVIGDITWTLVEGDGSTQPERVSALIDGEFFGVDEDGQTWRSADGISWQPTDPILDSDLAVVEIAGESWGRRFSPDGSQLVRWDGDKFVAVELPDSSTPLSDGLQRSGPLLGTPLAVGDEVVVPAHTRLEVPWSDLYSARVIPEWDAATETIRLRDAASRDQLPVAVVSAEWTGDARSLEFRDVETGEVVTTVEPVPDIAADEFFTRIIGGGITYNEFFIGDESGFEVVSAPWSLADAPRVAALDGRLIAVVEYQRVESPGAGVQEWELWTGADARAWEPLELPTPSRPRIDEINIVSDGALALLTIVSSGESVQRPETWSTRDGQTWAPVERAAGSGGIEITDVGWVQINVGESEGVSVSSDGLTWQNIVVSLLPPAGPGNGAGSVHGDTIFLTMNENGGPRSMWVGQVDDN